MATVALVPPASMPREILTIEAVEGTVGRSITLGASASQPYQEVATNSLSGTVIRAATGIANIGTELYSVSDVGVHALQGETPFWRTLEASIEGPDVEQLQTNLQLLGHYGGSIDGKYGSSTTAGVIRWQRAMGIAPTGAIQMGQVVAVPTLPAAFKLGEEITVGAQVAGGEAAVLVQGETPKFSMTVTNDQAASLPEGTLVEVGYADATWSAITQGMEVSPEGESVIRLVGPDGGSICGDECALLVDETSRLVAKVVIQAEVSGVSVPAGFVRSRAEGDTFVVLEDGSEVDVTVLGAGSGILVVEGIELGTVVSSSVEPLDVG